LVGDAIGDILSIRTLYLLCAGLQLLVASLLLGIDAGEVRRGLGSGASSPAPAEGT
jgi:hypothetical protein